MSIEVLVLSSLLVVIPA